MSTVAEQLVDFGLSLTPDDIPHSVRAQAMRLVADTLACAIGAVEGDAPGLLRAEALFSARHAAATVLGTDARVDTGLAAMVNTALVRYLDANDVYAGPPDSDGGHFSDAIPALLAIAEAEGCDGHKFLTMVVAAYEMQAALCHAFQWFAHGYHTAGLAGIVVPAAGAGARGLGRTSAIHAVGIAASTGLVVQTWLKPEGGVSMLKSAGPALSARHGIEALDLAARGLTAPDDALEVFFNAHGGADPAPFARLGRPFTLPRTMIKRYPAQVYTQAALEATLALWSRGVRADNTVRLTVYGHEGTCARVQGSPAAFAPATREDADHSTPFVVASALQNGWFNETSYDGEPWRDDATRHLMARVHLVVDPERQRLFVQDGQWGCTIVAELGDGRCEEVTVEQPAGHPDRPMDDAMLLEKMSTLVDPQLGPGAAQRLFDACLTLDTTTSIRGLLAATY